METPDDRAGCSLPKEAEKMQAEMVTPTEQVCCHGRLSPRLPARATGLQRCRRTILEIWRAWRSSPELPLVSAAAVQG